LAFCFYRSVLNDWVTV